MWLESPAGARAPVLLLAVVVVAAAVALASPLPALAQPAPAPTPAGDGGDGGGCFLGVICQDPATWLQQTITSILIDLLSGLARDFGDAIVGFINDVNFLTRTPENLSYSNDLVKQFATATQVLADG